MVSKYLSCPFCFDGYVKYDELSDSFYCLNCLKEVEILGYLSKNG